MSEERVTHVMPGTTAAPVTPRTRGGSSVGSRSLPVAPAVAAVRAAVGGTRINVLMVNNPQMVDLQKLTADNFTKRDRHQGQLHGAARERRPGQGEPGVLQPGRPVRRRHVSNYEIPFYAKTGWLAPLARLRRRATRASTRPTSSPPMTKSLIGQTASSTASRSTASLFLMYRKDVRGQGRHDAGQADLAAGRRPRGEGRQRGRACGASACAARSAGARSSLRSPRWSTPSVAPGSTRTGNPRSTARCSRGGQLLCRPGAGKHGEAGAPQAGFTECLNNMEQGKVAMWYDATSAAGSLEGTGSPGGRQDRPTSRLRWSRPRTPAGSTPGPGRSSTPAEAGRGLEVHLLGLEQAVRGTRRSQDRLDQRAGRQAAVDLQQPAVRQGLQRVRRADQVGHPVS